MVVVRKSNNDLRICIDPTNLNKEIKRPHYALPTIDDILPNLVNAKVFSVVDASNGFWQVELDEPSSYLTTFATPFGRYRWKRLPFGISSAPEEYQRRMQEALEGLEGIAICADDIIIYGCGNNYEQAEHDHDKKLRKLFQRCMTKILKLDKDELIFKENSVKYLGHITSEGLKAEPKIKVHSPDEASNE